MNGRHEGKVVRIDLKDGPRLLSRVEIPLESFAAAVMGELVHGRFTTDRNDLE